MAIVTKKNAEFYASATNSGTQDDARVEALPSGGYIAVWDNDGGVIRAQRFDSSGAAVGSEIVIASSAEARPIWHNPEVAVLSSGEFVIVWEITNQFTGRENVGGQRFAADGTPLGAEFTLGAPRTTSSGGSSDPSIFSLPGGGFVVTWQNGGTRAQIFNADGTAGAEIAVDSNSIQLNPVAPVGTALGDDRFVISWQESGSFRSQIYDLAGSKIGGQVQMPAGVTNPAIAAMPDGGYVFAWQAEVAIPSSFPAQVIYAQRYDSGGTAVGAQLVASTVAGAANARGPDILALPWGGFVVSWSGHPDGVPAIEGQLFGPDGLKIGGIFQINSEPGSFAGSSRRVDLALLASGEAVAVWSNEAGTGPARMGIKAQHLLMPTAGTVNGETLAGTGGDDGIAALGGNDVVSGGAGADGLDGGAGDDTLSGGDGADALFGSTGTDTADYSGETGPVAVNLHSSLFLFPAGHPFATRSLWPGEALDGTGAYDTLSGIENLILTAGNDRVLGSDGANRIEAGAGADHLSSAGGDDVVLAGSGSDTVFGGLGNDSIDGGDDSDTLYGEGGTDSIDGGGGNDLVLAGAEDDVIDGGSGNDVLLGQSGRDTLRGGEGNDNLIGGSGWDSFDGGSGGESVNGAIYGDRVSFSDRTATQGAIADLQSGMVGNDGFGNVEMMANVESLGGGTAFADTFYGNGDRNALDAALGDHLFGRGGDDIVTLHAVPGTADGGDGTDLLRLETGSGWLRPDDNGDGLAEIAAAATAGWEVDLVGGSVTDGYGNSGTVQGFESVSGSPLDDSLYGSAGANSLGGGGGADFLFGHSGDDTLDGGSGDDVVHGHHGDDAVAGGADNDLMRGGSGVDSFDGGSGGESVNGQTGYGDRVSFFDQWATQGVVADLRTGIISNDGYGNVETMQGIESLGSDTAFADTLYGNDSINFLSGSAGDALYGFGSDDLMMLTRAAAVVDGGDGVDELELRTDLSFYLPDSDGDGDAEIGTGMPAGWEASLAAGTLRDGYGNVGTVSGIENLVGSGLADRLRGSAASNRIEGGADNDVLLLQDGGEDSALGGDGNDVLYFGSALSAGDVADGGAGRDAIVLQGNVMAVLSETNLIGIESISIQSGANAFFGDTADNFYDYVVTTADANVAAGQQLIVNAQSLRVGEDFTFDGSAETDGRFLVYGGHGVDDLTGGAGVDVFFFEGQRWGQGDRVDGGAGRDSMVISAGSGLAHIAFAADSIANIESISLNNLYASDPSQKPSYELVLHNGNVAVGGTLIVNGNSIPLGQVVNVDGSAVQDGNLILFAGGGHDVLTGGHGADLLFGGGGADALTGGAGADTFRYDSASDSSGGLHDVIGDFQTGLDRIDLSRIDADTHSAGNQAFTWIGSNAFSGAGAASAGELRLFEDNGYQRIEGDTNGDGAADLLIILQIGTAPIVAGDFLL